MNVSNNTKRIAYNTIVLYVRMFVTMCIALYSSRIILNALGVVDFGIYNVVGGVVGLVAFLRTSLTTSVQRFLSYEMGAKDSNLKNVFSMCLTIHFVFAFIILILAETVGLWFLNNKLQIPSERLFAANLVYQFSIISLLLSTITVPYNADVISHEKMTFYALVSITEAVLKLIIAFIILESSYDKLILYGILLTCISIIVFLMYFIYCRIKYKETAYHFFIDKNKFKQIFSFSGWNILGTLAMTGANEGTGVLVNMFYPVTVNAAIGVAKQVNGAITGLTANFQTAFQPQITKSYAGENYTYLNTLICKTSKISFFLLFVVAVPIVYNIDIILKIWLGIVPQYSGEFCSLYLLASLFNALSIPLKISIFASGKIKGYQIAASCIFLSDILLVYLVFRFFFVSPVVCMMIKAAINMVIVCIRLYYTKHIVEGFSAVMYIKDVIMRIILSSLIITGIGLVFFKYLYNNNTQIIVSSIILICLSVISAYYIGMTKNERVSIRQAVVKISKHIIH